MSRSSALASKATGYPIAKVATKIALGYTLDEITNDVTGETCACFEPALDYVVVKYPKWPFDKFVYADKSLGTQMMATGEVMAIGNNFEHAMMKAVSSTCLLYTSMLIRNARDCAGKPIEVWLRDGKIAAVGLGLLVPEGEEPVSYTHLDVYKRQRQHCVGRRPAGQGKQCPCHTAADSLHIDVYKRQRFDTRTAAAPCRRTSDPKDTVPKSQRRRRCLALPLKLFNF